MQQTIKYFAVPLSRAKTFKSEISNLSVSHLYKPSIDTNTSVIHINWESNKDSIVVMNRKTQKILPWVDPADLY